MEKLSLGFVPSHLDEFDDDWAEKMRGRCIDVIEEMNLIELIAPSKDLLKNGVVKNEEDANKVIKLFKNHKIKGIIIGAMTFGNELPIYSIIEEFPGLPIMLFGTKELLVEGNSFLSQSFCGTLAISSGLHRRNVNFYFGGVNYPEDNEFLKHIETFTQICSAVDKFKRSRIGMVGLRPASFEACVSNEEVLIEKFKQRVIPINFIDIEHKIDKISNEDIIIKKIIGDITKSYDCSYLKSGDLIMSAKLELILKELISEKNLNALTIQCWDSIQKYMKLTPCLTVSRITDLGIPVACEGDIYGALTMLIQYHSTLGKNKPFFADWLMRHQDNSDVFLAWHCGNSPASLSSPKIKPAIRYLCPFEKEFGENSIEAMGGVELQVKPGPVTINRLIEYKGNFKMLATLGKVFKTNDKIRGSWGWIKVKNLEELYMRLINGGFNHHMSIVHGNILESIKGFCRFCGIEVLVV